MGSSLAKVVVIDFAIQWSMWILAAHLKTEKFYDLIGSVSFITLSLLSLSWNGHPTARQKVQTAAICAWAMRLGLFLLVRVIKVGADRRFNKVRDNPRIFFVYWTMQGLWVLVSLLPTLIMNSKTKDWPLQTRDYAGWTLWGIGFLLEMMADYQKST
jgi:steroid 5-alpha reductase family enzyme